MRIPARIGAYVGGLGGLVVSLALLPVTYPVALMAHEAVGSAKTEFTLFPAYVTAGACHFLLGAPFDTAHYLAYRAWTTEPPPPAYDLVPGGQQTPEGQPPEPGHPPTGSRPSAGPGT